MKTYRIGLLGGIGPISTGIFYDLLIEKLQKSGHIRSNIDFPNVIINSIPAPELTALDMPGSAIEPYIDGVRLLRSLDPDIIFMVCNTIHVYFEKVKRDADAPTLVSIRDCVEQKLVKNYKHKKICVLGTPLTVTCKLYDYTGLQYVNPDHGQLSRLGAIINEYNKSGDERSGMDELKAIIEEKKRDGAEVFLFACTEISALGRKIQGLQFEDTIDIMSDYLIDRFLDWKGNDAF